MSRGPIPSGPRAQATSRGVDLENLGFAAGVGVATDAARAFPRALATRTSGRTQISRQALELAMVTSRSREASEVVPSPEVGAVGSVGPAEEDQPPARSAHPRDSVWSATSTDTARNRRDGFASDETQHRPIRARFPSINVRPFPIKRAFLGAPRLLLAPSADPRSAIASFVAERSTLAFETLHARFAR